MIKESGYLKCLFTLENILCLIIMSGINFFNNHIEFMSFIFFIFNSCIVAEYIKLGNMMRRTRRKIFNDIIIGSIISGTLYCLCILGISKLLNIESFILNGNFFSAIQIIGIYILSGFLGIRIGLFTSNNLNGGKKFIVKLSFLCTILAVLIILCITFLNLFKTSSWLVLSNYISFFNILLTAIIGMIGIFIVFNIRKNVMKLEWK